MRTFQLLTLILVFLCGNLGAQSLPNSEKKVYKADNNRLYVNKDLGVYLWLSTSPNPGSNKILLKSDSSKQYSNPMYLDTEGYNTVRSPSAVDTSTLKIIYPEQDIIFEVYADGLPPVSSSKYSYIKTRIIKGKRYYRGKVKIELTSRDHVSGVESLNYSINSAAYKPYSLPIENIIEGENKLQYYSVDKVGNQEEIKEDVFFLDNTAPKTTYEIQGNQNEESVSADAIIKLSATDDQSGIRTTYYKINNGKYLPYTRPISASLLGGKNASISFYSVDLMGNKEIPKTIDSSVDL